MTKRTIEIGEFVTEAMFDQIRRIGPDVTRIAKEVIEPNMDEINRKLGQENDAHYLAYAVVHAVHQTNSRDLVAEIGAALEVAGEWTSDPSERGFEFRHVTSQGWTIRIGYGAMGGAQHQDGTACKDGTIVHLTPELALAARRKAEA
jgi:hypothetical protein